ncbi:TOPRIM nucleotidyl transferase/hydrolase domain-containing protein [Flavonifractor plautii]|uniref:TOPRIM nucleotidyl transferase/hydrolase domain-containing protein n=1 Tax=Flavonifractor plautii TaxID=292800 RepID=UPI003BAD1E9A
MYQRYITILGVNGRHAHRLSPLIEKLCLPTLVITDLDPAEKGLMWLQDYLHPED